MEKKNENFFPSTDENDHQNSTSEESEFNDGYASDLMGSDVDRLQLALMSEKERETEIFKRSESRETLQRHWQIRKKLKRSKKQDPTEHSQEPETRAKREVKQQLLVQEQQHGTISSGAPDTNNNSFRSLQPPNLLTSIKELNKLQVKRHQLEKILDMPVFDNIVIGIFIKVSITQPGSRNSYRVAEVVGVAKSAKKYQFGSGETRKAFRLKIGNTEDKIIRLAFISNQAFKEAEFNDWHANYIDNERCLPNLDRVQERHKVFMKSLSSYCPDDDTKPRINFAMAKRELIDEREVAIAEADFERVSEIDVKIQAFEERASLLEKNRTVSIQNITYLNERNRRKNIESVEQAIREEMRSKIKKENEFDPFSRRHTMPSVPFKSLSQEVKPKEEEEEFPITHQIPSALLRHAKKISKNITESYYDVEIEIDMSNVPQPLNNSDILRQIPDQQQQLATRLPYGWSKWQEYKKQRGLI